MQQEKVYIILLNYNGWQDTIECLESVLKLEYSNYQIIVVDNDSPNRSMDRLLQWAEGKLTLDRSVISEEMVKYSLPFETKPLDYILYSKEEALSGGLPEEESLLNNPIIFIQSGENNGFATGNNIAMKYALAKKDASYFWLLNNDTVIERKSLTEQVLKAEDYNAEGKKIGILGSKLLYYQNPSIIQGVGGIYNKWLSISKHMGIFEKDEGQYDHEDVAKNIDYIIGASMLVNKEFVEDVGLMSEEYFLYFEETDWIIRGKEKGWNIGYAWKSRVYHKEGGSIGTNSKAEERSEIADFFALKNKLIFTKKFYPTALLTVYLGFFIVLFNRIKRRQWKRVIMVMKIMFSLN